MSIWEHHSNGFILDLLPVTMTLILTIQCCFLCDNVKKNSYTNLLEQEDRLHISVDDVPMAYDFMYNGTLIQVYLSHGYLMIILLITFIYNFHNEIPVHKCEFWVTIPYIKVGRNNCIFLIHTRAVPAWFCYIMTYLQASDGRDDSTMNDYIHGVCA